MFAFLLYMLIGFQFDCGFMLELIFSLGEAMLRSALHLYLCPFAEFDILINENHEIVIFQSFVHF